jgi:phosphoesterase RecJ-like protein
MDPQLQKYVMEDSVFKEFYKKPNLNRYALIVCDTAITDRLEGHDLLAGAEVSFAIDHHASHEKPYTGIAFVQTEESCSELIYSIISKEKLRENYAKEKAIFCGSETNSGYGSPCAADYFYLGILHDTSRFSRATKLTLEAASYLISMGVDHKKIVNETMHTQTFAQHFRETDLLKKAERRYNGQIAYVYADQETIARENLTYDDIHPLSNILRDFSDITVAFTMYEESPGFWRCSFRSDGNIDVNTLLIPYGGGGHTGASSLMQNLEEPEKTREELIDKIIKLIEKS